MYRLQCMCLATQAQRYRILSDSFEKRVVDLQRELQTKEEEIAQLKQSLEHGASAKAGKGIDNCIVLITI